MKERKRLFLPVIMIVMMLFGFSPIFNVDVRAFDVDTILYITEKTCPLKDGNVNIVWAKSFKTIDIDNYDFIIVDKALMSTSVKTNLQEAFFNKTRIIIAGDISRNEVREYFGLEKNTNNEEDVKSEADVKYTENPLQEDNIVDVSKFPSVGKLIYQDTIGTNITEIIVEDFSNDEKLLDAFIYCFTYDYSELSKSADSPETKSYTYSWSNVDIDTSTYITARCTINTAIKLDKNDGNPNSNDEYLGHAGYVVDTDMNSGYYLDQTDVEVKGRATSLVYAYGPPNMTNPSNATISFGLPFSLNISFTPGAARVNISKLAGGINSNNLKTRFNPVTIFGTNGLGGSMLAEADIETYQPSTSYFYGYGQFYVKTVMYNWNSPMTYYNQSWDGVSGS